MKEIEELKAALNKARNREPQIIKENNFGAISQLEAKIAALIKDVEERDEIIARLRSTADKREREYIQQAPKVMRIKEAPLKEIKYEKDPFLIEQNKRLNDELEKALRNEQGANLKLKQVLEELRDANNKIAELLALPPKIKEIKVTKEVIIEKPTRIGPALEKLMDMYKKHSDELKRRLGLNMMYYYRLFKHYRKLALEKKEKVIVNQKLEVIDGTYEVWKFMRQSMVAWLLEVFTRSADRAHIRKM